MLSPEICARALGARDARFDGVFVVGITTTRVYCRPVCPARVAYPDHRRFFESAAAAEHAGYRPCLRCRPELAPGRALIEAVPRLARAAVFQIGGGALNNRSVDELARELNVSERHLRRALEREIGVSPLELAQTCRLLLAKRLLADTRLPVTRIAYASGFQSVRRFNTVFKERYRMCPSALRKKERAGAANDLPPATRNDLVRLTLGYRAPIAWDVLLDQLRREIIPGVELVAGRRYARTVRVDGKSGVVFVDDMRAIGAASAKPQLNVHVSASLLPALMPLLARLRQLFDLDAEPSVIGAHLEQGGLGAIVRRNPGMRLLGALDGFEVALRLMLRDGTRSASAAHNRSRRITAALGNRLDTGVAGLAYLAPHHDCVAAADPSRLVAAGVPRRRAEGIVAVARAVAEGAVKLEPGSDVAPTRRALMEIGGIGDRLATMIVMRALYWPDAFPASDRRLQRAAGTLGERALRARAERWRPWRAYAALHLSLD